MKNFIIKELVANATGLTIVFLALELERKANVEDFFLYTVLIFILIAQVRSLIIEFLYEKDL